MFKKAVLFTGFFAIVACSGDVYDEIDQQNEQLENDANNGGMQTNSFDDSFPGYYSGGIVPGTGYVSPWDVWYRNNPYPPSYVISKASDSLVMSVTAWVGLAYYDSNNDGFYNDPFLPLVGSPSLVADFWSGNYPNLFNNTQEIGNLIQTKPIILDSSSGPENELPIISTDHLPVIQGNVSPIGNPMKLFFDITGTATSQEIQLLADYGKVFYFEVTVTTSGGGFVWYGFVEAENSTLEGVPMKPYWVPTGLQANVPGAGLKDIHYYYTGLPNGTEWVAPPTAPSPSPPGPGVTNLHCDSREVVIRQAYKNEEPTGFSPTSKVALYMPQGSWLWQTSGLHLSLTN